MRSDYFWHIHETVSFGPEDRRRVPKAIKTRIEALGSEGDAICDALDILGEFLSHTFVFDNLDAPEPGTRATCCA
jgi:hypothetical protein